VTEESEPGRVFNPDWCIRPGLTLDEELKEIGLPMKSYARLTGLSEDRLRNIIAGGVITVADAEVLARIPNGPSARFWLALERNYRAALAAGKKDVSDG
jgi:plasmid maintenance system antidote protein VapI